MTTLVEYAEQHGIPENWHVNPGTNPTESAVGWAVNELSDNMLVIEDDREKDSDTDFSDGFNDLYYHKSTKDEGFHVYIADKNNPISIRKVVAERVRKSDEVGRIACEWMKNHPDGKL